MKESIDQNHPELDLFPIGAVATLTGVNPITLRAWERRYGLVKPKRTQKGHRLYTQAGIEFINRVVMLLQKEVSRRRRAWAAWNYHVLPEERGRVALTYNMNILQDIDAPVQFCVTLNHTGAIDPTKIIRRIRHNHPLYTRAGVAAQRRQHELNGTHRTFFCGAYRHYGFHEDGVVTALAALQHFEQRLHLEKLSLRRAG